MTAMWISSFSPRNSSSTSFASLTRSTSARPHEGHETKVRPPFRRPSDFKMSIPTRTSSVGSAESETRIVSPMPSERSRSEEHTSELQSRLHLVCRLLLEKKKKKNKDKKDIKASRQ